MNVDDVLNPMVWEMYTETRDAFLYSDDPEVRADKIEAMRACRRNLGSLGILACGVGEYAQRFMDFFREDEVDLEEMKAELKEVKEGVDSIHRDLQGTA